MTPLSFIKIKILNAVDKTKALLFEVHNDATTSTTTTINAKQTANRVLDLPDQSGILATQNDLTDYIPNSIVDAKGDIITATAADTPSRLPIGTNGYYLQADSTESTGMKWVAPGAGTGDVSGPASSVDNTIPRFDGVTGKIIQGSGWTIADNNTMTAAGTLLSTVVKVTNRAEFEDQSSANFFCPTVEGSFSVAISGPDSFPAMSGYVLKLPDAPGTAGQVLITTDGTQLDWATVASGPTFTDWTSFTPTSTLGTGGTRIYTGQKRLIGTSLDIRITLEFTGGQGSGTNIYFDMPDSAVIDTSKLTTTTDGYYMLGAGVFNNGGVQGFPIIAAFHDASPDQLKIMYLDTATGLYVQMQNNVPASIGAGSFISFNCFGIPIV